MITSKPWDWTKNTSDAWLVRCMESAWLSERWQGQGFQNFLDLGCGLGRHSIYMAGKGFSVTAADLSEYGVRHAAEWAQRENLPIHTQLCDMLALPFPAGSFDCMFAYNVIYHTDTAGFQKVLGEIARVLKPGGEIFLTLISKGTWGFREAPNDRWIDASTILRNEQETEMDVPHFYVDFQDIQTFLSGWNMMATPREWCEYNRDNPEYYSKHWTLLLQKPC